MPQTPSKVGDDKPPPPSPATEGNTAFAGANAEGDLSDNQASANDVGGIEGAGDPTYSSRATGGEKYGRANDHPHLAYIYRGRGTAQPPDEGVDGQEEGEVSWPHIWACQCADGVEYRKVCDLYVYTSTCGEGNE